MRIDEFGKLVYSSELSGHIYTRNFLYPTVLKIKQNSQSTYEGNNKTPSRNHFCGITEKHIIYSLCVCVVLVILHAKRMRHSLLFAVGSPILPYFSTLSYKLPYFRRKVIEH